MSKSSPINGGVGCAAWLWDLFKFYPIITKRIGWNAPFDSYYSQKIQTEYPLSNHSWKPPIDLSEISYIWLDMQNKMKQSS